MLNKLQISFQNQFCKTILSYIPFLKIELIHFNWRIISLQYCGGFCHTSTWITHRCTCVPPSWIPFPLPSSPHPSGLSQSTSFECPASCIKLALIIYFTYGNIHESEGQLVVSDFLQPHGLYSPWHSLGQNTGVGSLSLLQGIFPTQGLNPGLPNCRQIFYQLSHEESSFWNAFTGHHKRRHWHALKRMAGQKHRLNPDW